MTNATDLYRTGASEFIGLIHQVILAPSPDDRVVIVLPGSDGSPDGPDATDAPQILFPFPAQYLALPLTAQALESLHLPAQPELPSLEKETQGSLGQTIHDLAPTILCTYLVPNLGERRVQQERARVEMVRLHAQFVIGLLSVLPVGARLLVFTMGSLLSYR